LSVGAARVLAAIFGPGIAFAALAPRRNENRGVRDDEDESDDRNYGCVTRYERPGAHPEATVSLLLPFLRQHFFAFGTLFLPLFALLLGIFWSFL
jgi:hypothetical protein